MKHARSISISAAIVAGLVLVGSAIWLTTPQSEPFYTDAATIRASQDIARLRDVLWQPPEQLGAPLNTQESDEYEPTLSPDGLTMIFVRGKPGGGADLYQSVRTPRGWTEPEAIEDLNTEADELGPAYTHDGNGLYYYSDRAGSLGGYDIWFTPRTELGWGEPEHLGPNVNSPYNDYGPSTTPDGKQLYFASNRPRQGEQLTDTPPASWPATIRESFQNRPYDIYAAPVGDRGIGESSFVPELSSAFSEGAPAVSPSGDFIYFASDRPGGEGGFDLYRSRMVGDEYFAIEHLGDGVNTDANELDPTLGMGGFGLVFSSDRDTGLGRAYDLYRTESREVYRAVDTLAARMTWGELLRIVLPWLLLLALLLALLALLRKLATDERWKARWRKLGLMAKCLLVSGLVHMLILMLLTLWQVSTNIDGLLGSPGGSKVTLVSSAVGGGIESQVLAQVMPTEASRPVDLSYSETLDHTMSPVEIVPAGIEAPTPVAVQDTLAQQRIELTSSAPRVTTTQVSSQNAMDPVAEAIGYESIVLALPQHEARERVEESAISGASPAVPTIEATPLPIAELPSSSAAAPSFDAIQPMGIEDALDAETVEVAATSRNAPSAVIDVVREHEPSLSDSQPDVAMPDLVERAESSGVQPSQVGSADAIESFADAGGTPEMVLPAMSSTESVIDLKRIGSIDIPEESFAETMIDRPDRFVGTDATQLTLDDPGLFELDIALPEGVTLPEQVALPRYFSGVVLDAETGQPITEALVRIDSDQGDLIQERTADDGTFAFEPKFEAEFVAVTTSKTGYNPSAMNLPIEDLERGVVREIRLEPVRDTVIALEEDPEVHHLGDNDFGGRINSQFQKESEGTVLSAQFQLTQNQHRALGERAAVTLLAKGVQANNIVRINGNDLPRRLSRSPSDGSFGEIGLMFDASWLREGVNVLEIESQISSGSDHDDFEIVNIQILLAPPEQPERSERRRTQGTL